MKESPLWLRLYLGITGALAFLNIGVMAQVKGMKDAPSYALPLSFAFATLSVFCGFLLFFGAWRAERLLRTNPGFIKGVLVFRYVLLLLERAPFAVAGDFLSISLILLWTGMTFFMVKTTARLAEAAKQG